MGCRLYLVRHGETVWNTERKVQGHIDVPLAETGRQQAGLLAKRLSKKKFAGFYASDLQRALETAKILAEPHGLPVEPEQSLREMNFGDWEGLTIKEITDKYGDAIIQWWDNPLNTCVPAGETLKELQKRVNDSIEKIVQEYTGDQDIIVVSHGGPLRIIIASVLGMDLNNYWRLRVDNACLNIIDFREPKKGILVLFNDRSHLDDL